MAALTTELRRLLETTIRDARRVVEPGARKALEALAVDRPEPHPSMPPDDRALRTRLRAHGRQLGDRRDRETRAQEIQRLAHEVAYEHWHRMLFARFLAENQLLIDPESGVAISMAECEDLARDRGEDPWVFAGRAAARMLPRIFRPDDPSLEVMLAPEIRQALEGLLSELPAAIFTADDALGWTYQFWQAERKKEVDAAVKTGVKVGADQIPPKTQLFTEHYMVQFLFHNTIGAWRAGKVLATRPELAASAESEEHVRDAVRLGPQGGYEFAYLRFVRELRAGDEEGEPTGPWRPAAGGFDGWPRRAADLRVLDPCCGSGHFLVESLELLVRLRMEEEGLPLEDALRAVIAENLFGLEIDPRCTQIAAFNLALAAWKLTRRPIELPQPRIACTGLGVIGSKDSWASLAPDDHNLRLAMGWLHDEFGNARELGSLFDPSRSPAAKLVSWRELQPILDQALAREDVRRDPEQVEAGVAAQGLARAAELLGGTYTLVVTNVPYLGRGNQTNALKSFAEKCHHDAKADLATVFVSRVFGWLGRNGTQAVVSPQNWLFLASYKKLRERLLAHSTWNVIARLGSGAFETVKGEVVNVALSVLSANAPGNVSEMAILDASVGSDRKPAVAEEKARLLSAVAVAALPQGEHLRAPDARIVLEPYNHEPLLEEHAESYWGHGTGDRSRFVRTYWEIHHVGEAWALCQGSVTQSREFAGRENVVLWEANDPTLIRLAEQLRKIEHHSGIRPTRGHEAWSKSGVAVSLMNSLAATIYSGEIFDANCAAVVPKDPKDLAAVWAFCTSSEFLSEIRRIDQKLNIMNLTVLKVPFELERWRAEARLMYPCGLPDPQSDDPTQWLFHGHPARAQPGTALQVAAARLLGYRWPPERDAEMRLSTEARDWVTRCRDLDAFSDKDGIVPLGALRGESGAADRLRTLLAVAFGPEWSAVKERELLAAAAEGATPAASLEEWLRDRFFEEHCRLFHHAPFVWHVWDGRKDGFHALVNYHRLAGPNGEGRRTLEALTYSYLGDWILRQQAEQREGREGADGRVAAALDLQAQLVRILEGEPPCDIFVRWKALHQQPIGWEPDLDDGVRLNIRPFLSAELRTGGRKGAGILRWKPNVKWTKDRGQEPQSLRPKDDFPWFWSAEGDGTIAARTDFMGGASFDGNRWNDLHYTNATKQAARDRVRSRGAA